MPASTIAYKIKLLIPGELYKVFFVDKNNNKFLPQEGINVDISSNNNEKEFIVIDLNKINLLCYIKHNFSINSYNSHLLNEYFLYDKQIINLYSFIDTKNNIKQRYYDVQFHNKIEYTKIS